MEMGKKDKIVASEVELGLAILEMQELLKKLRAMNIPDKDEIFIAINFAKEEIYKMWKEMGKEN